VNQDLAHRAAEAARILRESRYVVSLVGAGISAESGIPTFRGPAGLWTRTGQPGNDQYQRFLADPGAWWRERRAALASGAYWSWERAIPNPAHCALAELEDMGVMRHVITQNVDNLHQEAGTRSISEFHGNRFKMRCIDCNRRWARAEFDTLSDALPTCPDCGGLVKSDTVMFGEPVPEDAIKRSLEEAEQADCCVVIGTSAKVYPAAKVPLIVLATGGRLIEVNLVETPLSNHCAVVLRAPAGEAMPAIVAALRGAGGSD